MKFKGFVMSDWGATHSTAASVNAGLDMQMPGGAGFFGTDWYSPAALQAALTAGQITQAQVDDMVFRILRSMFAVGIFDRSYPNPADAAGADVSTPADNQAALTAAEQGTVLLKNDRGVLPFSKRDKSVAVIGDDAGAGAMYGGGGSAAVNPTSPVTPLAGITSRAQQAGDTVSYAQGNANYQALSALPNTDFTPTTGTGPGWTATYYAGSTASGTPLGSEVVTSLNITGVPAIVTNAGVSTWSVKYTATMTPDATGIAEFGLSAGGNASLTIDGKQVVSYGPGTGSTFTGLASLTAGKAVPFELDATGLSASGGGGFFGPPTVVGLTWAPQENLKWQAAASAAGSADVAVVFASNFSSEGSDLQTLELPGDQDQLIAAVAQANPRTIVVLNTSGPASMPWLHQVAGVFEAWYPGQQDGNAIAALLFGDVSPSGHLPETFPASAGQGVAHGGTVLTPNLQFPGNGTSVAYTEGIDVGYRYYDVNHQRRCSRSGTACPTPPSPTATCACTPARTARPPMSPSPTPETGRVRGRPAVPHRPGRRRRAALPAQGLPESHPRPRAQPADPLPAHQPGPELLPDRHQQLDGRSRPLPRQHRQQRARPRAQRAVLRALTTATPCRAAPRAAPHDTHPTRSREGDPRG